MGIQILQVNLDSLAGQSLRFILRVEYADPLYEPIILWIQPHIAGSEPPVPSSEEGVVVGTVDFASAPPYLMDDPVLGGPAPVQVVAFGQNSGQRFWTLTRPKDPRFFLRLPPDTYTFVAYGPPLPDGSRAMVAYTGDHPACGQPLQPLTLSPGQIYSLTLNNWNTCASSVPWPALPPGIP